MIVQDDDLDKYLGNDIGDLQDRASPKTIKKLSDYAAGESMDAVDYLFLQHQGGKSLRRLSRETGVSKKVLSKVFDIYGLPKMGQAEGVRKNWQDPEFRERQAEAVRKARLETEQMGRYKLPSIHGYRQDIGIEAQTTWEANFARILVYCGRQFNAHETFRLRVPERYMGLFDSDIIDINIDFAVRDPRGNRVFYEIMAHPLEGERDYAKLDMLAEQYQTDVRIIDGKSYKKLQERFEGRINSDTHLIAWETGTDNLRTNPHKYGGVSGVAGPDNE